MTKITQDATNVLINVDANHLVGSEEFEQHLEEMLALITTVCGGKITQRAVKA